MFNNVNKQFNDRINYVIFNHILELLFFMYTFFNPVMVNT